MPSGDYIEGFVLFGAMLGSVLAAATLIVVRLRADLTGAERAVAWGLAAALGVLAVHLVPLALGILSRATVTIAALLLLGACGLWARRSRRPPGPSPTEAAPPSAPPPSRTVRVLTAASIGLVIGLAVAVLRDQLAAPTEAVDVLNFHLPGVARWLETGSLWQIDVFLPDVAPGHYPNNGDVFLLAAVLPWDNDFLAGLAVVPFWAGTGLAVYAIARELGGAPAAAITAACLVLAIPAVAVPALAQGLVDSVALFGLAAGILFLLRHRRTGAVADLVPAGLALGLAFGTKWYAVSAVAVILAVWSVALLREGRGVRRVGGLLAALVGLVGLAGGIWMLRNLIESGNPVFPVRVAPFGLTLFDAPHDVVREAAGFTIVDYIGQSGVWADFIWPQLGRTLAMPGALASLGALAALVWLARARGRPGRGPLLAGLVCAIVLGLVYAITPYSAGGPEGAPILVAADARYAVPALLVAIPVLAAASGMFARGALVFALLGALAVFDAASFGIRGSLYERDVEPAVWAPALLAVLAAAFATGAIRLPPIRRPRPAFLAVGGAVALAALALGGYELQTRFNDARYVGADPTLDAFAASGPERRVGIAGAWTDQGISPILPAFGPRLRNHVEFVGRSEDDMLRRHSTPDSFTRALREGGFDYLLVGHDPPDEVPDAGAAEWARSTGYSEVARSDRFVLLARSGAGGQ